MIAERGGVTGGGPSSHPTPVVTCTPSTTAVLAVYTRLSTYVYRRRMRRRRLPGEGEAGGGQAERAAATHSDLLPGRPLPRFSVLLLSHQPWHIPSLVSCCSPFGRVAVILLHPPPPCPHHHRYHCDRRHHDQVGPYVPRRRLGLGDHLLVGRTGFSVNRFDYGISERMGARLVTFHVWLLVS